MTATATAVRKVGPVSTSRHAAPERQTPAPRTASPFMTEGRRKPWETQTAKASEPLDPASLEAVALFSLSSMACEQIAKAGVTARPSIVRALTRMLAAIVLDAQERVTGYRLWDDAGNTRIRGALFAVTTMPGTEPPFGQDADTWAAWQAAATRRCVSIAQTAARVHADGDNGYALDEDPAEVLGAMRQV